MSWSMWWCTAWDIWALCALIRTLRCFNGYNMYALILHTHTSIKTGYHLVPYHVSSNIFASCLYSNPFAFVDMWSKHTFILPFLAINYITIFSSYSIYILVLTCIWMDFPVLSWARWSPFKLYKLKYPLSYDCIIKWVYF